MFGSIGGPELVAIALLALVLFGPRRLPEIGRTLGRTLAEFRGVAHEFRASLERDVELDELRRAEREVRAVGRDLHESEDSPAAPIARDQPPRAAPARDPVALPEAADQPAAVTDAGRDGNGEAADLAKS